MYPFPTLARRSAQELIRDLWLFERSGRFENGLREVSADWADPAFLPDTSGLDKSTSSELLLRFGVLLGYQGHYRLIKDSQLRARDILTRVLADFDELKLDEKSAECENHIALTYARTGEFAEARTWLDASLRRKLPVENIHRLATVVYQMFVNVGEQRYSDNLGLFGRFEELIESHADDWIAPSFYINAGIAYIEVAGYDSAMQCFEKARERSQRSSIWMHLGTIENESAMLYRSLSRFAEAHESVDRGIDVFRKIGDASREGTLLDTKAAIFLDEGRLAESLATIGDALDILSRGENKGFLAEAFTTKGKALLAAGERTSAFLALAEAVQIARTYSGEEFARCLIEQFDSVLTEMAERPHPESDLSATGDDLKLLLPSELAGHRSYQAIRIHNSHLSPIGIDRGSLVIAADTPVCRGDLAVVSETATGAISCGFFDQDFGVVCIEGFDCEPQLFDLSGVTVIGKIIGIVRETKPDGTQVVDSLDPHSFPKI